MREALYPDVVVRLMNKVRNVSQRINRKKTLFQGQVDFSNVESINLSDALHPGVKAILSNDYQRNNMCIEYANACVNGLNYVRSEDTINLLA